MSNSRTFRSVSITQFASTLLIFAALTVAGSATASAACTQPIAFSSMTAGVGGGIVTFNVSDPGNCGWLVDIETSKWDTSWVQKRTFSGVGNLPVTVNLLFNPGKARAAVVRAGNHFFTIRQPGNIAASCSASLPAQQQVGSAFLATSATVSAASTCSWLSSSGADWIAITNGFSGQGTSPVAFNILANPLALPRAGLIDVNGSFHTVIQGVTNTCTFSVNNVPASAPASGGSYNFTVTSNASNCTWSASSLSAGITVTKTSATAGTITISANPSTSSRTLNLQIAGRNVSIVQGGLVCSYVITGVPSNIPAAAGSYGFTVTANSTSCTWAASSLSSGVTVNKTGTNTGTISAVANTSTAARTLRIQIADRSYSITQEGVCSYAVSNVPTSAPAEGRGYTFQVSASPSSCTWSASSTSAAVTVTKTSSTAGVITVSPNTSSSSRSLVVQIAGKSFTVIQGGAVCTYTVSGVPPSISVNGGSVNYSVTASAATCNWTASSQSSGVTVTKTSSTNGVISVGTNTTGAVRVLSIVIADRTFSIAQAAHQQVPKDSDFDGDGKADLMVWRPVNGIWHIIPSSGVCPALFSYGGLHGGKTWCLRQFGASIDEPVSGDFDGDRKADIAVWRSSQSRFLVLTSSRVCPVKMQVREYNNGQAVCERVWGNAGEKLVRGDFDGDGKSDQAYVRLADFTWTVFPSSGSPAPGFGTGGYTPEGQVGTHMVFGIAGDRPATGDFDGDGKTDPAVWRPFWGPTWGYFFIAPSSGVCPQFTAVAGTLPNGRPYCSRNNGGPPEDMAIADYNGDGKDDQAFYRNPLQTDWPEYGYWHIFPSGNTKLPPLNPTHLGFTPEGQFVVQFQWGQAKQVAVQADYDGDGIADVSVYDIATGHWLVLPTTGACPTHFAAMDVHLGRVFCLSQWGEIGDVPKP